MRKNILQKMFVMVICATMVLGLSACGGMQSEDVDNPTESKPVSSILQDSLTADDNSEQNLASMDNLTVKPLKFYDKDFGNGKAYDGFVIEADVKNQQDYSVNLYPQIIATMDYTDDYGDKQTAKVRLANYLYSPYSLENDDPSLNIDGYLEPIGLAPKEEKTIRYYIDNQVGGTNLADNSLLLINVGNANITEVNLASVVTKKSEDCEYLPVSEWGNNVSVKQYKSNGIYGTNFDYYFTGNVTNNTKDRWEEASVRMDVLVDDCGYSYIVTLESQKIGIGKSIDLSDPDKSGNTDLDDRILNYCGNSQDHNVKFSPALLCYTPEH